MRKSLISCMAVAMLLASCIGTVYAASITPMPTGEQALRGANWVVEHTYTDLTGTTTNGTAQTITVSVKAKQGVELIAVQLLDAFDTVNTNFTGSVTLIVGDGTDANLYLESMELASDGTEVWLKMGRANSATITPSVTLDTVTHLGTNYVTNVYVTATSAISAFGSKVYTADDTLDFVFTPSVNEPIASNSVGKVRTYLRIWDAR